MELQRKARISARAAREMVMTMAKYGNHNLERNRTGLITDEGIIRFLRAQGLEIGQVAETCRNIEEPVPFFENLIGPTWGAHIGKGGRVSLVDLATGEESVMLTENGTYTTSSYWALYEEAARNVEAAVARASLSPFLSALTNGIATLDAYLAYRAEIWNKRNRHRMLVDTKDHPVTFDKKIDEWIPILTGGKKLDKGNRNWPDFLNLRHIRDNVAVHPKQTAHGISHSELAKGINRFRTGIAGLLIQLHVLFREPVPSQIIRGYYAPDVIVVET